MDATFVIGSESENLTIRVLRRSSDDADYWEGNWLFAEISVAFRSFRANVPASLWTTDFVQFREGLRHVHANLAGQCRFDTLEHWLTIDVTGDGRGHFEALCTLRDDPNFSTLFKFQLDFDQTELPAMIRALDRIVELFPVVGAP